MKHSKLLMTFIIVLVSACTSPDVKQSEVITPSRLALDESIQTPVPAATSTATSATPTAVKIPSSIPSSATLIPTSQSTSTLLPASGETIVINHESIALFEKIPEHYLKLASDTHLLFRHASVGYNITEGLDCLMGLVQPRPHFCDAGIPAQDIIHDPKYDRTNWVFEFHAPPPGQNPGWWDKLNLFVDRTDNPAQGENFDVLGFKFGYVDAISGSAIDDEFFVIKTGGPYPNISALEELEARHPDKEFIYWTIGLARIVGTSDSQSFNQQMREYAAANGKILMDIADIESHSPAGEPCFTSPESGIEVICTDYTTEREGGHLNAVGSQRMAKAMWVLMARLAGWDGK